MQHELRGHPIARPSLIHPPAPALAGDVEVNSGPTTTNRTSDIRKFASYISHVSMTLSEPGSAFESGLQWEVCGH